VKKQDFNTGWIFYKEDAAHDGEKRAVCLPHDAMIEEQRDPASPGGSANAYFPGGVYIYEKHFAAPADWSDKYIVFQFEGVYKDSKVYINGTEAGGRPYGYIPFFVETEGLLKYGEENTIRVVADNSLLPNSRWYSGGGIYRPVFLWTGEKAHINIEGVKISTLSYTPARIKVETTHTGGNVSVTILRDGEIVAAGEGDTLTLDIPNAALWSDETPEMYQCHVTLTENGVIVDEVTETFGIRLVEWSAKGLFVNGKETLLRGGCVHHDNGILGARSYTESEERRVRIMKQSGFNAIRSSHNPTSPAMLEACDKYGMYVMDETWDMWYEHKSKYDYATDFMDNYKADIKAMIDRDFNHPSVIMYSIGNEVSEPHEQKGVALAKEMTEYIHSIDTNRAVTCGVNLCLILMADMGMGFYGDNDLSAEKPQSESSDDKFSAYQKMASSTEFNMLASKSPARMNEAASSEKVDELTSPCLNVLDIAGYNYASGRYPLEGGAHPNRVILGSETYAQDIAKNWDMVKKYPYLIGDFMWTAWDYLGEAGIGAWAYTDDGVTFNKPYPWLLADAGAIDILGNISAEAEYAATVWGLRKQPYIGVQPVNHPGVIPAKGIWRGTNAIASWSWQGCEGNEAIVEVYADADHVELLLNDKRLSAEKVKDCKAVFMTRYAPGTLTAIAFDAQDRELSRSSLVSASGKIHIRIQPEKITAKIDEVVYVDINLSGKNGIVESNADTKLNVTVEGGCLLAFGSANPRTGESYLSGSFTTYYGRSQAVVRANKAGTIRITAYGGNMENAFAEIKALG
jgi:hypothetical protein